MSEFHCEDPFECSNGTVVKECYKRNNFDSREFFCDCSNWYGWTGDDCNEPTSTIYYHKTVFSFFLVWNMFNLLLLIKVVYLFSRYHLNLRRKKGINPIFYVALLEILVTVCFLGYEFIQLPSYYDATYFEPINSNSLLFESSAVERRYSIVADFLLLFAGTVHSLGAILIVLSWLNVFEKMSHVVDFNGISTKKLKTLIIITFAIVAVTFAVLASFKAVAEVNFGYIIGSFIISASYIVGYLRFRNRMKWVVKNKLTKTEKHAILLVKRSMQVNTICFSSLIIFSIIYYLGIIYHLQILRIGGFNYFLLAIDIMFAFTLLSVSYTGFYAHRTILALIKEELSLTAISYFSLKFSHSNKSSAVNGVRKTY